MQKQYLNVISYLMEFCMECCVFLRKLSIVVTFSILTIKANVTQPLLTAWRHKGQEHKQTYCVVTPVRTEECSLLTSAHTLTCQQDKRTKCLGSFHSCCSSISISAVGRQKPQTLQDKKLTFYVFSSVRHLSSKSPLCVGSGHFCFLAAL